MALPKRGNFGVNAAERKIRGDDGGGYCGGGGGGGGEGEGRI